MAVLEQHFKNTICNLVEEETKYNVQYTHTHITIIIIIITDQMCLKKLAPSNNVNSASCRASFLKMSSFSCQI